jgi:phage gp29-like protein
MSTILDQFGKPIDSGTLREAQTADTAWLQREFENHPSRGLTPARLHNILVQAEQGDWLGQLDLADDLEERDGHAYAELSKRKGAISMLDWDLAEPDAATAAEKKVTAQLREWMKSLPDFEDVLFAMMDGVLKGFANHEMVWKLEDGVLLPEITFRPQRWFTLDAKRDGLLLRSHTKTTEAGDGLPSKMGEPLRPFAWLSHIPRSRNGYLARSSLVRVLCWPYLFKAFSVRDLAEFLEIYGLPLRLGQYPAGASNEEKRTLLRAVTEIGHNAAGIIPQGMKIDFQNAAAGTHVPFMSMIDYMDGVESKAILGQTLTSGEGKSGTQALGTVHEGVRMDIRAADARQVEGTISRQLLYPLAALNIPGVDLKRLPRFSLDFGEAEDLVAYSDALPKLANAGMQIPRKWAHDKLRIPEPMDGEEVLNAAPPPAPFGAAPGGVEQQPKPGEKKPAPKPPAAPAPAAPKDKAALATALNIAPAPRDALDAVIDEALSEWRPLLEPMVEPLLAAMQRAIANGQTLEEFRAQLPGLVGGLDSGPLAERQARAAFTARLAGEADLDLDNNGG